MLSNKVSIIIPVYNQDKFLDKCLTSVVNQTYKNLEIICVNDGSTDNSLLLLEKYRELDSRIVILNKENGGLSSARNFAYESVTGQYVMFLDSDDWLDLQTIEIMLSEADREDADSVMCSYVREFENASFPVDIFESEKIVFSSSEELTDFHRRLFGPIGKELKRPERIDAPISSCMQLIKKEIALSSLFMDTKNIGTFEDGLYQIEIYPKCKKIVYLNKHFYHYRKTNSTSLTTIYRPLLFDKWNNLYDILFSKIKTFDEYLVYKEALYNRVALCFVSLCLNEVVGSGSNFEKAKRIKKILKTDLYKTAFKKLSTRYMPFKWKLFFCFAKLKCSLFLTFMANYANNMKGKVA